MTSALTEKIIEHMTAKNVSIAQLERLSGLSIHSVRDIIKGRIKRPSAQSLQAIAGALGCSLLDLVEGSRGPSDDYGARRVAKGSLPIHHPALLLECCAVVLEILREYEPSLSLEEYLETVKKVYTYSSKKDPIKLDVRFAQWLVETQVSLNG